MPRPSATRRPRRSASTRARIFKTLIASIDGALACGVVPVAARLDLKALAAAVGGKRGALAEPAAAARATGYVVGGISPIGQRGRLPVVIDSSAEQFDTVFVSAGKRGLQVELAPAELARAANAQLRPDLGRRRASPTRRPPARAGSRGARAVPLMVGSRI